MSVWVIIPMKSSGEGKTRLASVLSPDERDKLALSMFQHVLEAARSARNVSNICVVGGHPGISDGVALTVEDPARGLNAALTAAQQALRKTEVERIVVLAGDLPQLTVNDVELLAAAPARTVAIGTDRHGTGTNGLSLPMPEAEHFAFAFGEDSFARHRAEAERLGLAFEPICSPGLSRDVDVPADLIDTEEWAKTAHTRQA